MSEKENLRTQGHATTRRQIIVGTVLAIGGLAAGAELRGQTPPQSMQEGPSTPVNAARTSLRQEVVLKAEPRRIYEAILDSKQFAAFSGMAADIDRKPGGAFAMFGGQIEGRNVELTPNTCIVQA